MATNYNSKKLSLHIAEQFNESFSEPEPVSVGYVFVGNHIPYVDENVPDEISETVASEKSVWDSIFAMKKITGSDMNLVLLYRPWSIKIYSQYDDRAALYGDETDFYCVNSIYQVYKCLSNNNGGYSTIEPSGDYSVNNGIVETSDGYIWKYMYAYDVNGKFVGDNFFPVPLSISSTGYYMDANSAVDGAIYSIAVSNVGSNYTTSNIIVSAFTSSCNKIVLNTLTGVSANMYVYGTGIANGTYVTAIGVLGSNITLSQNTISSGGGTANNLLFRTRVIIEGDGSSAEANAIIGSSNTIDQITLTSYGQGYSYANVRIYGNGQDAAARAIIGPKFGHGYFPSRELSANSVMISVRIGQTDTTEGGLISETTTIRQYGFLRDPHLYSENSSVGSANSALFVEQLYTISLVSGSDYIVDELVYQGSDSGNSSFSGYINSQTDSAIKLSKVRGQFSLGDAIIGVSSGTSRGTIGLEPPTFEPYTGDILYVENITPVERTDGQSENFKFVLRF